MIYVVTSIGFLNYRPVNAFLYILSIIPAGKSVARHSFFVMEAEPPSCWNIRQIRLALPEADLEGFPLTMKGNGECFGDPLSTQNTIKRLIVLAGCCNTEHQISYLEVYTVLISQCKGVVTCHCHTCIQFLLVARCSTVCIC